MEIERRKSNTILIRELRAGDVFELAGDDSPRDMYMRVIHTNNLSEDRAWFVSLRTGKLEWSSFTAEVIPVYGVFKETVAIYPYA